MNIIKLKDINGMSPEFAASHQDIDLNICDLKGKILFNLECKKSSIPNAGLGIFTNIDIPKGIFLGDYVCEIKKGKYPRNKSDPYCFGPSPSDKNTYRTALDIKHSNWARNMNCSSSFENENVLCNALLRSKKRYKTRDGKIMNLCDKIFFWTKRDIKAGEELMYYYSHGYAIKHLNIRYRQHLAPKYLREYPRVGERGCLNKLHNEHEKKWNQKNKNKDNSSKPTENRVKLHIIE